MPEPMTIFGFGLGLGGLMLRIGRKHFEITKKIADVLLGVILLGLSLPMMAFCIFITKLSSRGPAFYTQIRLGKNGRPFRMYKLRTMYSDAEQHSGVTWARKNDNRVVPPCRWMRLSHLDELPQLVNVIRGEMSLVGPRPERPEIMQHLRDHYDNVDRRLAVRPGITGLAQIRAGYDTDIRAFRHKLKADLEYIANRHWGLDLLILLQTIRKFYDKTAR